jgi:hypothetical protein
MTCPEQVGPGGEFARPELFQAKAYSNDLASTPAGRGRDRYDLAWRTAQSRA